MTYPLQAICIPLGLFFTGSSRPLEGHVKEIELADSVPGNQHTGSADRTNPDSGPALLRDLGISRSDSSGTQQMAALPEKAFERYIAENVDSQREPTTGGLLREKSKRIEREN